MDKIKTQDVYLPVDVRVRPEPHDFVPLIQGHWLEKHNMVCLSREDFEKAIGDAFDAGCECSEQWNAKLEYGHQFTALEKPEYINSIIAPKENFFEDGLGEHQYFTEKQ